jgi:hypothetical protein
VIVAVLGVAMFAAGTVAVNLELLTKVVDKLVPFQYTVDPATKPSPVTVKVKEGEAGRAELGLSG